MTLEPDIHISVKVLAQDSSITFFFPLLNFLQKPVADELKVFARAILRYPQFPACATM
jgi:hypothetical protein